MRKFCVESYANLEIQSLKCCGIYELEGIGNHSPAEIIFAVTEELSRQYNMIVFHDAVRYGKGTKLCAFIRRHKLGTVTASKKVWNPNTSRDVQMWTWYPDWSKIHTFVATRIKVVDGWDNDDY